MKTSIRVITIIIVLVLFTISSVGPVTAQVSQQSQTSESVATTTQRSSENEAFSRLRTMLGGTMQQRGGAKVLVIPTAQIPPQQMATLMEDMTVMCRIFDKKLAQSNLKRTMSYIGMTLPGGFFMGGDSLEAMYVQGYGALFMTTVDFPLSPPPETEEKEQAEEEQTDPVWKQMRQEMFSPQQATVHPADRPGEKYDPEKVENLKATLIKALVHAANIRGLNTDESVILTVTGKSDYSNIDRIVTAENNEVIVHYKDDTVKLSDLGVVAPMALVIRAKKSDIDALAQNKDDFNRFKEKVGIISCPCLGGDFSRDSSSVFFRSSGDSVPSSSSPASQYRSSGASRRSRGSSRSSDMDVMVPSSSSNGSVNP
ncbi:MAG: hypothetical protein JW837_05660 [Sedimentisphaerales bacterium]|nr:hypothetical protein [Sedimentisphaerales bacterium]